ncbi:MAG: family 16 glycoside hydrolase [Prosthecobacter sp.]
MKYTSLFIALLGMQQAAAETPAPPATQICKTMELIAAEKFDGPESFAKERQPGMDGWRAGIGTWSIVDGAAYAKQEGPSKNRPNGHEAVCEHLVDLGDYMLSGEFKLGASPQVGFVCRDTNKPNHHQGRVVITPTAIWIQKMSGIAKETRREELTKIEVKLDPTTWHRFTVEVCGDRWLARIDDHTLEARHERFKDRKGRIGMVARGEGAQFRNLSLWSAEPKP